MSIATELTALSGHITNAYDAVQTKGGTIPANKNMANLDDAILSIQSGADITNGTVKQYKASSTTVLADTFFEFVEGDFSNGEMVPGAETQLSTYGQSGYTVRAAKLTSDSFLVVHQGASFYLTGSVCTVNGNTIVAGNETVIENRSSAYSGASVVALGPTSAFVTYAGNTNSITSLHAKICTISGTTITTGTGVQLSGTAGTGQYVQSFLVNDSRVFVTYGNGTYLCGMLCELVGDTIVPLTGDIQLVDMQQSGNLGKITVEQLTGTSYLIAYHTSSSNTLCGRICTISDTSITIGAEVQLANDAWTNGLTPKTSPLTATSILLAYVDSSRNLKAMVCTVSGTSITTGSATTVQSGGTYYATFAPATISPTEVYASLRDGNGCYSMICTISGTTITAGSITRLNNSTLVPDEETHSVLLDDSTIVTLYDTSSFYLVGVAVTPPYKIQASQTKINGVTIDDITTSTAGDVWVFANDILYNGDADTRRY